MLRNESLLRMRLLLEIIVFCCGTTLLSANQNFKYEKMHNFGIGRRLIPNFRRLAYEYPEPRPTTRMPIMGSGSFPKLYQGVRRKIFDKRVFRKDFDIPATNEGQKIVCQSLLHCTITHVAIETDKGIPIILRGGVGYYHFTIVVRAKPGNPLKGNIRIFCNKEPGDTTRTR